MKKPSKIGQLRSKGWTNDDFRELYQELEQFFSAELLCQETDVEIRERTGKFLLENGFVRHQKGFQYIIDAIVILRHNRVITLEYEVYPEIAKFRQTNSGTVHTCIQYSLDTAFKSGKFIYENKSIKSCLSIILSMICEPQTTVTLENQLLNMGFSRQQLGFQYIIDAVELIKGDMFLPLRNGVYVAIAKKRGLEQDLIEKRIGYTIQKVVGTSQFRAEWKKIGNGEKPTPSKVIRALATTPSV